MDRNEKFLKRLKATELAGLEKVLAQIKIGKTKAMDIKRLSGHKDIFRVRTGTIRVIFIATPEKIEILEISRRSEKTYKKF